MFFFSQKNTEEQNTQHSTETLSQPISESVTANRGLTPSPSPNGEGSEMWGYPYFAASVLIGMCIYLDASLANPQHIMPNTQHPPLANHQHLTTITQHPSLAVTLCELCMPEAFCGLETVRKNAQWTLCALWEKNLPTWLSNVLLLTE